MWFMFLGMLFWVNKASIYRASQLFSRWEWPDRATIGPLVAVGLPIGIAVFAESSIFSVIALLIGGLDENVVAGHQIALNFSALVFMIPYSLGMAVTVRVGHNLGAGLRARAAAGVGMAAALGYACVSASLMLLLRERIAAMYSPDPAVIAIAASLIVFSALFQFSDALQVTAAGALRGYQDTRVTMIMTLFAYWGIGLPVGYSLGLTDWFQEPTGPRGLWQGPGGGPDRRGDHALHPPGAQRAALHPPARAPAAGGRGGRLSPWPVARGAAPRDLTLRVVPTEARMIAPMASHWVGLSRSPRNSSPESAPKAGSMLIRVPKVRAGRRVSATISRV